MSAITIKTDSSGTISIEMGTGASVDQSCKPGEFYVYAHKDKDGTVFYVGKGTRGRAKSRERPPEWHEYVEKRSGGKFSVEIVRDGISEKDAMEIEDAVMKLHGGTIVNRQNAHAPYDAAKMQAYCDAQKNYSEALQRAVAFKKTKEFDRAIPEFEAAYAHYADVVRNGDYDLGARNRLKSTAFAYHPNSELADGYSMVLAKAGRHRELVAFAERYFRDYAAPYTKAEDALRRRMEKAQSLLVAEGGS